MKTMLCFVLVVGLLLASIPMVHGENVAVDNQIMGGNVSLEVQEGIVVVEFLPPEGEKRIKNVAISTEDRADNQSVDNLSEYLKEGNYSRLTPEIIEVAERIYASKDSVYVIDVYSYTKNEAADLIVKHDSSGDLTKDYIIKALNFIGSNIRQPSVDDMHSRMLYGQVSAHETLKSGMGYCDERAILFKSLMLAKGIPVKMSGREWAVDDGFHSIYPHVVAEVWYNGEWVKVDPSFRLFGVWAANGREVEKNLQGW